ncbi:hypothetical protein HK405_006742 [Cladochytrium tenue]|nr:hypothetical protein HK405_006742 [Cladochytrium tenue]
MPTAAAAAAAVSLAAWAAVLVWRRRWRAAATADPATTTISGAPMPSATAAAAEAARRAGRGPSNPFPPDTVVLHCFPRPTLGWGLASMSPYVLKLETYLRVSGVPYILDHTISPSFKGATPYISYNGVQIPDSYFAIQWLEEKGITKKLDESLDASKSGVAEAYRMLVVNLCDLLSIWNWIAPKNAPFIQQTLLGGAPSFMKPIIHWMVRRKALKRYKLSGHARHSRAELLSLADRQLDALAALLGSSGGYGEAYNYDRDQEPSYILGTSAPTTLDCAVFGLLCQFVLAGNARVHAAALAAAGSDSAKPPPPGQLPLGEPKADVEVARAITPAMVRYVRQVGRKWFPDFAAGVSDETWRGLEADARAAQASRRR